MALGYSRDEILNLFHNKIKFDFIDKKKLKTKFIPQRYKNYKLKNDLVNADNNKKVLKEGTKVNIPIAIKLQKEGLKNIYVSADEVFGRYFSDDIFNEKTGEVYFESGD